MAIARPFLVVVGVVFRATRVRHPELMEELSVAGEDEHVRIIATIAANPEIVFGIGGDAVIRLWPIIALGWTAKMADEITFGVELENLRRGYAALAGRRVLNGSDLGPCVQAPLTVNDVYVIPRVDGDTDRGTNDPMVRKRLRPHRVDLEHRRLYVRLFRGRRSAETRLPDNERDENGQKSHANNNVSFPFQALHPFTLLDRTR